METYLKIKIDYAMTQPFVGSCIFTNEELSIIYDDVSRLFRSVIDERGETIPTLYYNEIFVALVNLAKEWASEEDAFFDFVYRKLLGSEKGNSKAYNQIVDVIQHLYKKNKIFLFKSFTKKYYTTLCSHAFAPISSMNSFFDMCWEIYCNDLNQQYIKKDPTFEIIVDSLKNKFSENKNVDDDFQIGSKSYALRAGIRGLALDEKEKLVELLETTIHTINSLFNNEIIEYNDYLKTIIKSWWTKKELEFGTSRVKTSYRKEVIINDYSQIKPRYIMTDEAIKLYIPPIRLNGNFNYEPYLEIQIDGQVVKCEPLKLYGSGILMATKSYEVDISEFNLLNIHIQITHCDKTIYDSKKILDREFILFNSNGKEIISAECTPNIYFLYITNFNNLLQYPKDMERINLNNTFSINAMDGDIIQTKNKTVFFLNEKSNKDILFSANRLSYVTYRAKNEEYCVIDGELYVELINDSISCDYGVKYEDSIFKLTEFDRLQINERVRYCISSLLLAGETQHISIFKYSDNSIIASINLIKFNNININFEKDIYYGKPETSFVEFKTDKYHLKQPFLSGDDEVFIPINDGHIIVNPPLLKWKIDDGEWFTNYSEKPIWYKDITNSSILYVEIPKDKIVEIGLNNYFVEKISNKLCFKIGEMIYRLKEISNEMIYTAFAKLGNSNSYHLFDIYIQETFISAPFEIDELSHKLIWNPSFYVGDKDSKFKLILKKESEIITQIDANLENTIFDLINIPEGYYNLVINLVKKSFLAKEVNLLDNNIILGNEKSFKYKGKFFAINNVMLFGRVQSEKILPVYIESINYLGNIDGYDYYSGFLYAKNKEGKKIYLSKMTKDDGSVVQINPVRIEYKTDTTCYLGFGLNVNDIETFDYNGEFTLSRNRVSIDWQTNGIKNKSIDYFEYEVKNV